MRKPLRIAALVVAALATTLVAAGIVVYLASNAKLRKVYVISVQPVPVPPATDATAMARGKHLAATRGCFECHGADLGGKTVFDNGAMGRVDGPNLTRGRGGVPSEWTDLDFVRAIRHGVSRDGRGLFLMPSTDFATFSDSDLGGLIAYINSVPPVDRDRGPVALGPVARVLTMTGRIQLAAEKIDHAHVKPAVVTPGVTVEYGRYVAAICSGCHGSNFSGGKIAIGPPDWPPAANLTPHADGRITHWTEEDFFRAIRTAKRPDGSEINPVMPRGFAQLEDVELKATWAFLKTLPAAATGVH